MKDRMILASANKKKITELKALLPFFEVFSIADIGFAGTIPEPYLTFRENAFQKADTIYRFCGGHVLADDSGICVEALGGAPGVHSARYAGEEATDQENLAKLIVAIEGQSNRRAFYKAVLCLIWKGGPHYFEGECYGTLIDTPRGSNGFGYDPIFVPDGYDQTFAELDPSIKQRISHRAGAMQRLQEFIAEQQSTIR